MIVNFISLILGVKTPKAHLYNVNKNQTFFFKKLIYDIYFGATQEYKKR